MTTQAVEKKPNGTETKLDVTSWVSVRVVLSVLTLVIAILGSTLAMRTSLQDVADEVRDLRKDVKVSLRILANTVSMASDDRHTAAAELAIWNDFHAKNPAMLLPDVKKHQLENPPKANKLYIPMLEDVK